MNSSDGNNSFLLLAKLPPYEGGERYTEHDCDQGHEMRLVYGSNAAEFEAYCNRLIGDGFAETARYALNGNLFRTLQNVQGLTVHTYLVAYSGEVRIIAAQNPTRQTDIPKEGDYPTFLKPLTADGGMGYLLRLNDGSFIVIDGGYGKREICVTQLYEALKANAPDPEHIVISCWIFTHGHHDHIGAFVEFVPRYFAESCFEIKSFLHNMCLTPEQSQYLDNGTTYQALETVERYYPKVPVYFALTGQIYRFANAAIEILYTIEDYMPKCIENEADATPEDPLKGNGNIQSVVFRVTVNGHTLFFMADTATVCCNEMCNRYGATMKSEYVQMAHHGHGDERPRARNATKEIYDMIAPRYGLLPCRANQVAQKLTLPINQYLVELIGGVENLISSGGCEENILLEPTEQNPKSIYIKEKKHETKPI